ncbi:hypothetical protein HPB51_026616 [Rhipicephalus microplus]|uniref:Uncharacterized protein n=1 Tax=Rhipicephalus microplus TaxID=6941 RepID=A0A9J6D2M3_RHIMP|nr:hypothetical protein HPB51_026616 [Rhipicephalus microplus]
MPLQAESNCNATLTNQFNHGGLLYPSDALEKLITKLENAFTVFFSRNKLHAENLGVLFASGFVWRTVIASALFIFLITSRREGPIEEIMTLVRGCVQACHQVQGNGPFDVAHGSRNADSAVDSPALATAKRTGTGGHVSEDYQQYSYSDEVSLAPGVSTALLPITKTIRRWRTKAVAAASSLMEHSVADRLVRRKAFKRPPSAQSHCRPQSGTESIPKVDHSYTMADDSSPWNRLLALCAETKEVKFQQIFEDKTSIVHDKFPEGLWDALSCYHEGQASKDTASAEGPSSKAVPRPGMAHHTTVVLWHGTRLLTRRSRDQIPAAVAAFPIEAEML